MMPHFVNAASLHDHTFEARSGVFHRDPDFCSAEANPGHDPRTSHKVIELVTLRAGGFAAVQGLSRGD